jgi:hypothetical protein
MKLLRTIRFDASDPFVFDKAAEPGEWAVSGAFAFTCGDPAKLQGRARSAFRAGFLGLASLGRSTLVQIVEAHESDREVAVSILAAQLVAHFVVPRRSRGTRGRRGGNRFRGFALHSCAGCGYRSDALPRAGRDPRDIPNLASSGRRACEGLRVSRNRRRGQWAQRIP